MTLSEATKRLSDVGIENARAEARALFSHFENLKPSELITRDMQSDSPELLAAVERRERREPLQYILGETAFYNEIYKVTPDVLIPRSDTEILVDYAVKNLPDGAKFADICTGSGCIAISTLNNTKKTSAIAVDISESALEIARENAARVGVLDRIEFISADILTEKLPLDCFAVLSNPPYVTTEAYRELEKEIYHEPALAFLGGDDGLIFYRRITEEYKNAIPDSGFIGFEIGYDQADALKLIADGANMDCKIIKDYSQNDRVAILTKRK